MSTADAPVDLRVPRLTFQLPGRWLAVDPRDQAAAYEQVDVVVRDVVGAADDAAIARRRLREVLRTAIDAAHEAEAHGMFLCLQVAPGVATPASLTVHAPTGMRMSPAADTSADAVLKVLAEGLRVLEAAGADTARRLDGPRASMLRIERLREETVEEDGVEVVSTSLEAEYWFAVPGTKHVVLASFVTPLGEIRNAMLNLFDSIALAASFGPE